MKKINILFILGLFISAFLLLPQLPEKLPMHWNVSGEIDSYWPKNQAVWFIPFMSIIMFILFQVLPSVDPKKNKYSLFKREWEIIQTGLIGFFTYLQFVILYISLNPAVQLLPLMFIGLGSLFVLMGNYLSKIRQNYFLGIKVPWTLASEDNWNKTHRFASWCFVIIGIVTIAESYFIWYTPVVVFGGIMMAAFLPIVYSFLIYKKQTDKMKFIYMILIMLFGTIFIIRLASSEDGWICEKGQWIKHGFPSAPKPLKRCQS
jgi:uncharacterized membrane protein